jgi:hypothetical protein
VAKIRLLTSQADFKSENDVKYYHTQYRAMADPALANNTINKTQYRYFFYLGIPSGMKV